MSAVRPAFDLRGRVAVVTGGSAGIGLGIARALGLAGADVSLWARDEARLEGAKAELAEHGVKASHATCDVTVESEITSAMDRTVAELGVPDVFVANAGAPATPMPFVETSLEDWDASLRGNLTSTFLCFQSAARLMVARGEGGSLIAVSSAAAIQASPQIHHYAAAKLGLHALVRSLAHELAPSRIRCNVLVPGFTETSRVVLESMTAPRRTQILASIPAERAGRPDDLGAAAVYLADPSLSYQTGTSLVVDGGLTIAAAQNAARAAWEAAGIAPPLLD